MNLIKIKDVKDVNYSDYESGLMSDGMLRDLWVFDSTMSDWQAVLDALTQVYSYDYWEDGEIVSSLPSAKEIHSRREIKGTTISFEVGRMRANSFFICEDEIDFDFGHLDILPETFA